jgi:serum/glucocorticoid-regulated kinase 2
LQKDAKKRLGHNGVAEIKDHVWFDRINWEAVKAQKIKPPFILKLSNETDTTNFDTQFTKMPIQSFDYYCDDDDSGQ